MKYLPIIVGACAVIASLAPFAKSATTQKVKIYLVALEDNGKIGRRIGCDDSLVAVTRKVPSSKATLKSAVNELLATPRNYDSSGKPGNQKLSNYWLGPNLKLRSVSLVHGKATIRFSGAVQVAGVCDIPRVEEQIKATAMQFPTVKQVDVWVGNQRLNDAIR